MQLNGEAGFSRVNMALSPAGRSSHQLRHSEELAWRSLQDFYVRQTLQQSRLDSSRLDCVLCIFRVPLMSFVGAHRGHPSAAPSHV